MAERCDDRGVQTVTPYLLYADAEAAIDFLVRAFGFRERLRYAGEDGRVNHAELVLGEGEIMLGAPGGEYRTPEQSGVMVHVYLDDVDAHFDAAREAGARIESEPKDQPYGDRSYHARDTEGHSWYFSQHVRDVAPEEWGATVKSG
jgi:uncharacterized glyoxalase superfamily protein PhnB